MSVQTPPGGASAPLLVNDEDSDYSSEEGTRAIGGNYSAGETTAGEDFQPDRSQVAHATSNAATFVHLVKASIGTGILAMPVAVLNAGLFVGLVGILFLGLISTFCMHQLLRCNRQLLKRTKRTTLDYASVAEFAFATGPPRYRRFAKAARWTVNLFLCITQLGFCCVYILFCAQYTKEVVHEHVTHDPPVQVYATLLLILIIPYVYVRNLRHLTPFSMIANVLLVISLVVIFQFLFHRLEDWRTLPVFAGWSTMPLFFGSAMYAFEAIGLILPMENKMKTPKDFGGTIGLLSLAMTMVVCLYSAIGFYGYLRFGPDTKIILSNLSSGRPVWLYDTVKICFTLSVFISYNLQIYPVVEICYPSIKRRLARFQFIQDYGEYVFRTILVLFTFLIAVLIPCLEDLISLIGALASAALALIFPPILDCVTFHMKMKRNCYVRLIVNALICLFGVFGAVTGTYTSIQQIVRKLASGECHSGS